MSSASLAALLQAALMLLSLLQNNPNIPAQLRITAIETAQHALSLVTAEISIPADNLQPTPVTSPSQSALSCPPQDYALTECAPGYQAVRPGTDASGCPLPTQCVPVQTPAPNTSTCPPQDYALTECAPGYQAVRPGTDASGCPLPTQCVPIGGDSTTTVTQ
jgi:hypothetical protein